MGVMEYGVVWILGHHGFSESDRTSSDPEHHDAMA
jgi:hypothetical protein